MFKANEASRLSNTWNWLDTLQMKRYERKIKCCCRKGERKLVLTSTPRKRVVEKLKKDGYEVNTACLIGAIVKW